jgi:hypothetical protein
MQHLHQNISKIKLHNEDVMVNTIIFFMSWTSLKVTQICNVCLSKYFENSENNYVLHLSVTGEKCVETKISLNFNICYCQTLYNWIHVILC